MPKLQEIEFQLNAGYFPNVPIYAPPALQNTIRAGANCWIRANGRVEVANGAAQTSATNVGARLFQYNTQRASIEGALVSGRLPYAGFIRYQNAAALFVHELTSKQIYLDETAVTGLTTSATAGRLRVGFPGSSWTVYDAGFEAPTLPSGNVTTGTIGTKSMAGSTGVALCAWRTKTNAVSAPATAVYSAMDASTANNVYVVLPTAVSGQDGWILAGTNWGDASGDLHVVRYVYITPRGTFTATNGSPTLAGDANTRWLRDLRKGDILTIDGNSYTVSVVTSNTAVTLTANFSTATNPTATATITTVAADWRNGELSKKTLSYDVFRPDKAAGIFSYAQRAFLWGCRGADSTAVTGPTIIPLLDDNPEHIGLTAFVTANGDDLLNVLPGETRLFAMTANTLEAFTFTGSTDDPYRVRVLHQPGFAAAMNGVIYKDRFYGYSEKPLRTTVDDNVDAEFAVPVWSDMKSWTASRVVLLTDPKNEAVLYSHYDGSATTTLIPFMTNLGVWGVPHTLSGQIVDSTTVNGTLYFTLLSGGNYRVQTWEGGTAGSASSPYLVSQFQNTGSDDSRKVLKAFTLTGRATTLRVYRISPASAYPDISNIGAAVASFTMSGTEKAEKEFRTHISDARAIALRVEFPASGSLDSLCARGYIKESRV